MRIATPDEVRSIQLELLSQFEEFCKQQQIQYFAFAGTLLGTIRHKGFIPWDNDIDVAVSRNDYEKMQRILKDENAHPYFRFLCFENDPLYLWQHGRISAKHTLLKTAGGYSKLGLSIDVFPLDNQGDDEVLAKKNLKKIRECVLMRITAYNRKYKGIKYPKVSFWQKLKIWAHFSLLRHNTEKYWVKRHIRLAQKFKDLANSLLYGCNSNDKYTVVCKRSMYDSAVYLPFEDRTIPVPSGYDDILKLYYGDYMKLPPREKQIGIKQMTVFIKD